MFPSFMIQFFVVLFLPVKDKVAKNDNGVNREQLVVRIAEIEIHKEHLAAYNKILKEESAASVELEPGVIAIFPMYLKEDSTQIRILEIYASREAYQSHLQTPHFKEYKSGTLHMVKSLKLVEMQTIDPDTMPALFRKLN